MNVASLWSTPRRLGFLTGGVIFIVVALTLSLPLLALGQKSYTAEFARSAGLKNGDEVRVAGIGVGKVRGIELAGDRVDVRFTAKADLRLGEDTRAEVKLGTLLGSTYLDLTPAGPGSLKGGIVPLRNTFTTFQIQEVIEGAGHGITNLNGDKLRQALMAVADTLPDNPKTVGATLDGLSRLANVVNSRDADLERLLVSATSVAKLLRKHGTEITTLMAEADNLLQAILVRKQAVHDILVHVRQMSRNLSGLIKDNEADVKPLLDRLNQVTTMLKRRDAALGEGLRILGPVSRYMTNAVGNGPYVDLGLKYAVPDNVLCASGLVASCR
jgi:phospholipid/cholesterol/gamma-HCH transport system substrate-binding protein